MLPQQIVALARGLSWHRDGDTLHLDAPCPHQAIHAALADLTDEADELAARALEPADDLRGSEADLLAAVPHRATDRDLRPQRVANQVAYEVPLLRFHLAQPERTAATVLIALAFLLLVAGSILAVRAAHGSPGERVLLAGQALRAWTRQEITRVDKALRRVAVCCVAGVAMAATATAVGWATTETAPNHLVRITTTTGERCGEFVGSGPNGVTLKAEGGRSVVLPAHTVTSVAPVSACG